MLRSLFGCKSIERILLYLLVNEKCYAQQLHRMLQVPLTPIQKGLVRLEEGGIISSSRDGKIRIYQFNPDYPLFNELEELLKKAFYKLPPHEKKCYYYLQQVRSGVRKQRYDLLESTWQSLKSITSVRLLAKSRSKRTGWNGIGSGKVAVKEQNQAIIFTEQGSWRRERGEVHNYSNSYRWIWNRLDGMLSLEHLRRGEDNPVFLFHLIPTKSNLLESLHSHLCGEDTYFGWLQYSNLFLQLNFRTIGPKKNEEIEYVYT